jgi:hypothetical protein
MKQLFKNAVLRVGVASAALLPMLSHATGADYTTLTSSVDYTAVISAVLAVCAAIVALYLVTGGSKVVLRTVKSV